MVETYQFLPGEDYWFKIIDITPSETLRPHKHEDVYEGIQEYTYNVERVEKSNDRRRGSDCVWLVDDTYYILCSRDGLTQSGNKIVFSENTPEELRYTVVSTVFEKVSENVFGSIETSELPDIGGMKIGTPKQFVLQSELSDEELESYYDDQANLLIALLEDYYDCTTADEIRQRVKEYHNNMEELFYDYIPREPSIIGEVVNDNELVDKWSETDWGEDWGFKGRDIDIDEEIVQLYQPEFIPGESIVLFIDETGMLKNETKGVIEVIQEDGVDEEVIEEYTYTTREELEELLEELLCKYS